VVHENLLTPVLAKRTRDIRLGHIHFIIAGLFPVE
jgi:hypothetical protein